jgi:hypothetical protein
MTVKTGDKIMREAFIRLRIRAFPSWNFALGSNVIVQKRLLRKTIKKRNNTNVLNSICMVRSFYIYDYIL